MAKRGPLDVEQIVGAAVSVADDGGIAEVSMRNVGRELGVEAMSLYHHVAGKEALLDALVERIFEEIYFPVPGAPWRVEMVRRAESARRVLASHPWALGLMESRRQPGPAIVGHHEAVLACLRADGFSVSLAGHAFSALDAYVYGFVLTEQNLPFEAGESAEDFVEHISDVMPVERFPHMHEFVAELISGKEYDYGNEFGFGLDLILDGIEGHLAVDR